MRFVWECQSHHFVPCSSNLHVILFKFHGCLPLPSAKCYTESPTHLINNFVIFSISQMLLQKNFFSACSRFFGQREKSIKCQQTEKRYEGICEWALKQAHLGVGTWWRFQLDVLLCGRMKSVKAYNHTNIESNATRHC